MKLSELIEGFKIPLTVTSLSMWPSPTKGEQHSKQFQTGVDPKTCKIKLPKRSKAKRFWRDSV